MEDLNYEEYCFICNKKLDSAEFLQVTRGMETLKRASAERNDGFLDILKNLDSIKAHTECRRLYTNPSRIKSYLKQKQLLKTQPEQAAILGAMQNVYTFIEKNQNSVFSFDELKSHLTSAVDDETVKTMLLERFKDNIIFSSKPGFPTLVCLKNHHYDVLVKAKRVKDLPKNKEELLKAAADILSSDVQSAIRKDRKQPVSDKLLFFAQELLEETGKAEPSADCISISNAIMSIVPQPHPDTAENLELNNSLDSDDLLTSP